MQPLKLPAISKCLFWWNLTSKANVWDALWITRVSLAGNYCSLICGQIKSITGPKNLNVNIKSSRRYKGQTSLWAAVCATKLIRFRFDSKALDQQRDEESVVQLSLPVCRAASVHLGPDAGRMPTLSEACVTGRPLRGESPFKCSVLKERRGKKLWNKKSDWSSINRSTVQNTGWRVALVIQSEQSCPHVSLYYLTLLLAEVDVIPGFHQNQ